MSAVDTVNPTTPLVDPATCRVNRLREAADRIVGSVFYGTLLRMQRESQLKGPYGHGGRGEEVFRGQLDQFLAEEAGRSRGFDISDAIVARFESQVRALASASVCRGDET
jgi:hypothetical protein